MRSLWRYFFSVVLLVLLGFASCGAPRIALHRGSRTISAGPKSTVLARTPTAQPASDEEAISRLIAAEGGALARHDVVALMDLWADDAVIVDAKHTPDDGADDAAWRGKAAVISRYADLVFPSNSQEAGAKGVSIEIAGHKASSTTLVGSETARGGSRWTFVKRDGRWWIAGLTYNLEK